MFPHADLHWEENGLDCCAIIFSYIIRSKYQLDYLTLGIKDIFTQNT